MQRLFRVMFSRNVNVSVRVGLAVLIATTLVDTICMSAFGLQSFHYRVWYVADFAGAICSAMAFFFYQSFMRESIAEMDAYQANDYYQKVRIGNSLMLIGHFLNNCNHISDLQHQNCRSAINRELTAIQSVLDHAPTPETVKGKKGRSIDSLGEIANSTS